MAKSPCTLVDLIVHESIHADVHVHKFKSQIILQWYTLKFIDIEKVLREEKAKGSWLASKSQFAEVWRKQDRPQTNIHLVKVQRNMYILVYGYIYTCTFLIRTCKLCHFLRRLFCIFLECHPKAVS